MITWLNGLGESLYKGVDATKVYNEILNIGDDATPEQIVEAAKDESSELHKCFTWDDTIAAEKWRKQEARQIRHFLVIRNENKPDLPPVRVFHFTKDGEGYKPIQKIYRVEDEYQLLLKRAYAELHNFSVKYKILRDEIGEILDMIDMLPQ